MCAFKYILHIIIVYLTEVMFVRGYDSSVKQCMFCVSWFMPYTNIETFIKKKFHPLCAPLLQVELLLCLTRERC